MTKAAEKPLTILISTETHVPSPWYGQYRTHAHNHITRAVAAIDAISFPEAAFLFGQHQGSKTSGQDLWANQCQNPVNRNLIGYYIFTGSVFDFKTRNEIDCRSVKDIGAKTAIESKCN